MDKGSDAADIADGAMASGARARRLGEVSSERNCLRWRESNWMKWM